MALPTRRKTVETSGLSQSMHGNIIESAGDIMSKNTIVNYTHPKARTRYREVDSAEFREWISGDCQKVLLWTGEPGIGKSSLLCHAIEELRLGGTHIAAFVYCDHMDKEHQTTRNIIGALLSRMITHLEPGSPIIKDLEERCRHNRSLSTKEMTTLIQQSATSECFRGVSIRICLDALDELDRHELEKLLHAFAEFCQKLDIRLLLTSRSNSGIEQLIAQILGDTSHVKHFHIQTSKTYTDIHRFLAQRLKSDARSGLMDDELEERIHHSLGGEGSTFLLASLNVETLLKKRTKYDRKMALSAKAQDLNDVYERTIERIKEQDNDFGMRILHWILFAMRPLSLQELQYALAIRPDAKDLTNGDLPSMSVVDVTLGLVTMDHGGKTVRFVHLTFKEYLHSNSTTYFPKGHALLAEVTLSYLSFDALQNEVASQRYINDGDLSPFFQYAIQNWGHHMHGVEDEDMIKRACGFFQSHSLRCLYAFRSSVGSQYLLQRHMNIYCSPLHAAAYFGLTAAMLRFFALARNSLERLDVNMTDVDDRTPLSYAAEKGHCAVVGVLLKQPEISVNIKDRSNCTPISYAAEAGHLDIVGLLLKYPGIHVDGNQRCGHRMLLSYAAEKGYTDVVGLLLRRTEKYVNCKDDHGRTPLSYAAGTGHADTIRLLLKQPNVYVNAADTSNRTPLSYAAEGGHHHVVKLLLSHPHIHLNVEDGSGRTPISYATERDHREVIKLLSEHPDICITSMQRRHRMLLSYAADNGHPEAVELLLGCADINKDSEGESSTLPLTYAVETSLSEIDTISDTDTPSFANSSMGNFNSAVHTLNTCIPGFTAARNGEECANAASHELNLQSIDVGFVAAEKCSSLTTNHLESETPVMLHGKEPDKSLNITSSLTDIAPESPLPLTDYPFSISPLDPTFENNLFSSPLEDSTSTAFSSNAYISGCTRVRSREKCPSTSIDPTSSDERDSYQTTEPDTTATSDAAHPNKPAIMIPSPLIPELPSPITPIEISSPVVPPDAIFGVPQTPVGNGILIEDEAPTDATTPFRGPTLPKKKIGTACGCSCLGTCNCHCSCSEKDHCACRMPCQGNCRDQPHGRNLVISIAGTSSPFCIVNTNVVEFHSRIERCFAGGCGNQLKFYLSGMGNMFPPVRAHWKIRLGNALDFAVSWRFSEVIQAAYKWLMKNYRRGDRIFLFGFSRGAYQVRVLAEMLHWLGLLDPGNRKLLRFAYDLYISTYQELRAGNPEAIELSNHFKHTFSVRHRVQAHFVGVWDTTLPVGVMKQLPPPFRNERHMCYFRHALALDECRVKFIPEYLDPGDPLSDETSLGVSGPAAQGNRKGVQAAAGNPEDNSSGSKSNQAYRRPRVKEVWFAGSHSDIGGGYKEN